MGRRRDPGQRSLFGEPEPEGVRPVEPTDEQRALAARLPATLRLGTSSWSFPGWSGLVYDGRVSKERLAREGLRAYAKHPLLRAVGIDRTYYRPVSADTLRAYREQVDDGFRFLVKAARDCTSPSLDGGADNPLFLDPDWTAEHVVAPFVEGLGPTGARLVFQFPPLGRRVLSRPEAFVDALAVMFEGLPALAAGSAYAVELRDEPLLFPALADALDAHGVHVCYSLHTRVPPLPVQRERLAREAPGPLTVRWMLHAGLGYEAAVERYEPFDALVDEDPGTRATLADACLESSLAGHDVIVIVNNKAEGSSPLSVFRLAEDLARRGETPKDRGQ